ncbi:uncharacterized protein LOC134277764 [Saccostrea cucullata]|uniref:uncharacterized protein LOC134277764 n=1 Tax=Saccostrea cuccullata TaxID=36930 RepID=UPI002ED3BB50
MCILCSLIRFLIALSLLSDQTNGSLSRTFVTDGDSKESDTFRHLLNQESIIRMSLTNTVQTLTSNFQSLMKDMLTSKESTGSRISQLEAEVEHLKTENQRLDSELQRTKAKEGNLSSLIASIQGSLTNVSSLVSVSSTSTSWNSGTLDSFVITNEGNGYNPRNKFTAPTTGLSFS